mmetsp:Transcript_13635/g.52003  ORF Transcript_13635/g.52003 Transcript_13635/m.52003 type:complete len:325 (-) Transcript_13635:666-1640(-)
MRSLRRIAARIAARSSREGRGERVHVPAGQGGNTQTIHSGARRRRGHKQIREVRARAGARNKRHRRTASNEPNWSASGRSARREPASQSGCSATRLQATVAATAAWTRLPARVLPQWDVAIAPESTKVKPSNLFPAPIERPVSGTTLSTTGSEVNSLSKLLVSAAPRTMGLNGEGSSLASSLAQSSDSKKGCALMLSTSASPEPRRRRGSLARILLIKSMALPEKWSGKGTGDDSILSYMSCTLDEKKGGRPCIISYVRMPSAHQSTSLSWASSQMTSGARYSGVPQKVSVFSPGLVSALARPKSVRLTWPWSSSRMFSGLRSR